MKQIFFLAFWIPLFAGAQLTKRFQWIGGPTYLLQLGSFKILTDPMLGPKSDSSFVIRQHPSTGELNAFIRRFTAPAFFDTSKIDLLLISHLHADHFDNVAKETLSNSLYSILPSTYDSMLRSWGFLDVHGLAWNDTVVRVKGKEELRIIAVPARHALDERLNVALGKVNGYILEYKNGGALYRIYWSGDTVWFDELTTLKKYGPLNLFIPNMGAVGAEGSLGRRGLNAEECIRIMESLQPVLTIPVHHSTFSHYVEPISVLQKEADKHGLHGRIKIPSDKPLFNF